MSAYIVDRNVIAYIVEAAVKIPKDRVFAWYPNAEKRSLRAGDYREAERVGNMLLQENARSVNFRYKGIHEPQQPEVFTHELIDGEIDPVQVLGAIQCYRYQSCEHPEWEGSEAYLFVYTLQDVAISLLTEEYVWGAPEIIKTKFGPTWGPCKKQ